jgi:hypothetical protein
LTEPVQSADVAVTIPAPAGQHAAPEPAPLPQVPAGAGSPLGALRERRSKMQELLYKDMRVPRWGDDGGPAIWVRFAPASPSEFADKFEKLSKAKNRPKDWSVAANAQVLVSSCMGVYSVEGEAPLDDEDDTRKKLSLRDGDPYGEWTKFDPDLAESLGLEPNCGAVAVVRSLYLTEGDVTSTANQLLRWSGMVTPDDDTDFSVS